ncbi:MAG: squalene/phytoene synthase family protein [Pseudomonadales bacterium]|nr:squalene/phytoene synthase family protein [Pseudomonadales bacterium]
MPSESDNREVTRRIAGLFDPQRHVREIVERSKSSFRWGMSLLPKPGRDAMYAIYSFCRELDDVADEPGEQAEKLARLSEWRKELDRLYEGSPTHPITMALLHPVKLFKLPREEFVRVIEGMESDALGKMWGPPWLNLYEYCRRVAGSVGLLSIHAFREPGPRAAAFAVSLGNA